MNHPADVAASTPAQPAKAIPANTAAPAPQAQNQSQANPPVVTPAPDMKSAEEKSNFEARVQAAVDALRRQDAEKAAAALEAQKREEQAKEQVALEAQKRQEAERLAALEAQKQQEKAAALEAQKRQERDATIQQINSTLTNQVALLSKYKTDCLTRLDNNTNELAKVAATSKKSLTKIIDELRQQITNEVQSQEISLGNAQKDAQAVSNNPRLDPRPLSNQLTGCLARVEIQHKSTRSLLDELETTISNAPPQAGLLDFIKITTH
jgi:hypothetical protein